MHEKNLIRIYKLRNPIRDYEWGSKTFISNLLGRELPAEEPQAEMWLGTNPLSPSKVKINGSEGSLLEIINQDPKQMLGHKVAVKFGNKLPFLFKVLAAASPLSLQAHPASYLAEEGFKLENEQNIPLGSPERTYKDVNHKPELICALTGFEALCGFQSIAEIVERVKYLGLEEHFPSIDRRESTSKNLKKIFLGIMSEHNDEQPKKISVLINKISAAKARNDREILIFKWITKLAVIYPYDMGVFAPLFLNLVKLSPGDALFIDAGVLHSYLNGCGVEIMANSDNVLRGGLTNKKVDLPQLTKTLEFSADSLMRIEPEKNNNEIFYKSPANEFQLSKIIVIDDKDYINRNILSAEILLCVGGEGKLTWSDDTLKISSGESVFVPQAISEYICSGDMELFRAVVPIQ